MRRIFLGTAMVSLALLGGCQATNFYYESLGYGPPMEYAQAQCEIGAMGTEQGMVAWGSPSYVAGAQIGNALGNEIRRQQFMKNCMVLQGWRQVPITSTSNAYRKHAPPVRNQVPVAVPTGADGKFRSPGLPKAPKQFS